MVQDVTYYPILEASGDEMIKEDNDLEPKKLIHEPLVCFVRSIGLFSNLDYQIIVMLMFSTLNLLPMVLSLSLYHSGIRVEYPMMAT